MKKTVFTKILSAILASLMLFSLASCSSKDATGEGYYAPNDSDILPEVPSEGEEIPPEDYGKLVENPWISTLENPTSTFSSDVDTASYARFRAFVTGGGKNSGGITSFATLKDYYGSSIRTEEMLNYFKYSTKSPENGDLFGVKSEIAPCPWNSSASLLMMTFKAKEVNAENKGNNLVFLIDVSGSMASDDKLPLLKKAFNTLISELGPNDRISIVTYSGEERTLLKGCKGTDKDKIKKAVSKLEAGGSTNGSAGMEKAYSLAQDYYIDGGNNRIIMATDGDLNVGITSTDGILDYVEEKRESGIYISTVGFGSGGYNDSMLETIADNGNGAYYFIDGESEIEKVFGSDLLSTLYTVAEDVKFQLTFNSEAVDAYRLIGYENRLMNNEDFTNDAKDAGEVGSGQELVVCYELKFAANGTDLLITDVASLAVRYKNPGELEANQNDYTVDYSAISQTLSNDMKFAYAVIVTAMLLHDSEYLDENITLDYVKDTLGSLSLENFYKKEFRDIINMLK